MKAVRNRHRYNDAGVFIALWSSGGSSGDSSVGRFLMSGNA
jgi:hypothetical protein